MTIAQFIENDLRVLALSGQALPFPLTLSGISDHYAVSLTPVRTAVDALLDQGILRKLDNGRLSKASPTSPQPIASAATPSDATPSAATTTDASNDAEPMTGSETYPSNVQDYEQELTELAIHISLRGEEQYLRETETSTRLGVGRSVVRSIFGRLSGAGFLEHVPRCGWVVRPFRESDLFEYIEVREVLELKALDLARHRLDPDDLSEMLRLNQPGTDGDVRYDNSLHQYWIGHCGNRYIQDFFARHGAYYETLFESASLAESSVAANAQQHREILEHLIARQWQQAKASLRDHIQRQQPKVIKLIASHRPGAERQERA